MNQHIYGKLPADQLAQETLAAQLAESPGLEDVHVWVVAGMATLTGRVREQVDLVRIDQITLNVHGVYEINNECVIDSTLGLPKTT